MSDIGYQIRRGFDKVSFEADKMMRAGREKSEATRIRKQADQEIMELGEKVLELESSGKPVDPELRPLIDSIRVLHAQLAGKNKEIEEINAEVWVAPPPPPPVQPPDAGPPPQLGAGESPQATPGICPSCNSELRRSSAFCPNCGLKIQP
ncbi:MAG TPA: zinc ribbon domain-containing protein [Chloroflexia bacterium]|nr:zinc ribbon domain-containing protein [Chloroflexia bacterium]